MLITSCLYPILTQFLARCVHTHLITILENNCQGPILIRVSPIWMITQNHFVPPVMKYSAYSVATRKNNHVNNRHSETRSSSSPMLIRVSPLYDYYNLSVYYFFIFFRPLPFFPLLSTTHNHSPCKLNHSVTSLYSFQY